MLIITVGITCLVGILTAIDTILFSMSDNFNRLGANSFSIYPSRDNIKSNKDGKQTKRAEPISFKEAMEFKERYNYGGTRVAVDIFCTNSATFKYKDEKTNPTYRVVGVDENYFFVSAFELEDGRNFSVTEIENGNNRVILGSDVVKVLFDGKPDKAIGQYMSIGNAKYKIIGTLKQKGSSSGGSNDSRVFIPLLKAKSIYGTPKTNYAITTAVTNAPQIEDAVSAAIGTMRNIRSLSALRLGTIAIALMTLLGAAIGLMNIMLVSVTERTREIGVRKALGATRNNILIQFLTEAIVITQMGGILGIIFGIILGLILSFIIGGQFVVPWNWILLGIIVCIFVGVVSGLYPAMKASRLDPIESLRYE